jgi:hypothetical protein
VIQRAEQLDVAGPQPGSGDGGRRARVELFFLAVCEVGEGRRHCIRHVHGLSPLGARRRGLHGVLTPPARFRPPGTVLGAQETFAVVNPVGMISWAQVTSLGAESRAQVLRQKHWLSMDGVVQIRQGGRRAALERVGRAGAVRPPGGRGRRPGFRRLREREPLQRNRDGGDDRRAQARTAGSVPARWHAVTVWRAISSLHHW